VSLVQSSLASTLPFLGRIRRMVVVSFEDAEHLAMAIGDKLGERVEVVRTIRLDGDLRDEDLPPALSVDALRRDGVSGIVVANGDHRGLPGLLMHCRRNGIQLLPERIFWEQQLGLIDVDSHEPTSLSIDCASPGHVLQESTKRVFDVTLATMLLIVGLPLMLLVALLVKVDSVGSPIYRQERVGLRGRVFTLYKFRSMQQNAEADGSPRWASIGDPRVTRVGKFLRYTRIDELPQLLNVLRGDMSIVGPRPERPYFVEKLTAAIPSYSLRHSVRPGITGWAQVNASYGASIEDARVKLSYDMYYLKHRGLVLDILVLIRTLRVVLFQEGAR
jgi:exopolysaccharide biosynthesis polyprenyl glycosylphosphotransferase